MNQDYKTSLLLGQEGLNQAVSLLQAGECVALPTETVYGLAADASNVGAVNKIFAAKGRPTNHPLIVHIPDVSHLQYWAKDVPEIAYKLADAFWPGPLTLLLHKAPEVPNAVTGGLDSIALRVPAHPLFLAVLKKLNKGLAAPSANLYKQLSPTIAQQVMQGLDGRIAGVLEGGPCEHGLESSIVDLISQQPRILRSGPITQQQLEQFLGQEVQAPQNHIEIVPGNVKAHYQPHSPLRIAASSELISDTAVLSQQNCHFIVYSDAVIKACEKAGITNDRLSVLNNDSAEFGRKLYLTLYLADQQYPKQIIIEKPPISDAWAAVNDRLSRAAQ